MNVAMMTALLQLNNNQTVTKVDSWKYVYRVSFNFGRPTLISKRKADRLLLLTLVKQETATPYPDKDKHLQVIEKCYKALTNSSANAVDSRITKAANSLKDYLTLQHKAHLIKALHNLQDFYITEEKTNETKISVSKKNKPVRTELWKLPNYVQIKHSENGYSLRSKVFQDAESIPDWCSFKRGREGYYWTSNYGDRFLKQKAESLINQFGIKEAELV